MAAESGADLSLWEFRQLVRQAPTKGLTANQRSNLYATLDVLFKKMKNGDERIRLGDIHFFLRNVSTKMHALQESKKDENLSDGPSPSDVADKVMLRVGRSFFRHVKQQNPDNNSMHENFTKMFQRFDSQGEGHLSRQELGKALKTMGVALSANQELMLFEAIDTDRSGTIEINEFLNFLNFVEKKIAERTCTMAMPFLIPLGQMLVRLLWCARPSVWSCVWTCVHAYVCMRAWEEREAGGRSIVMQRIMYVAEAILHMALSFIQHIATIVPAEYRQEGERRRSRPTQQRFTRE